MMPIKNEKSQILSDRQISDLRALFSGRLLSLCFGSGVDSTAMIVALYVAGIEPDIITFADTGGEKPETIQHLRNMDKVVRSWGWRGIEVCKKETLATTKYDDLYGNCLDNQTLPSLAFGMKSCSIKWKQNPQDQFIKGVKSGPNKRDPHPIWIKAQEKGIKIIKLIGYDCGKADMRRSKKPIPNDDNFDYLYPLQVIGWTRKECVDAIKTLLGVDMVPVKSACFFCPASKHWELYWLAENHPELLEKALLMERVALTGRHSRFTEIEFGASWESFVVNGDRFPSSTTTVGLGRSFSWNQWALMNDVVDSSYRVKTAPIDKERFRVASALLHSNDNALDSRDSIKQ